MSTAPGRCCYSVGPSRGGGVGFKITGPEPPDAKTRAAVVSIIQRMSDLTAAEAEAMLESSAHCAMVTNRGVALARLDPLDEDDEE